MFESKSEVEKTICDYAREKKWLVLNTHMMVNRLSIKMFLQNGIMLFMVFKDTDKPANDIQKFKVGLLTDAGFNVHIVDTTDHGKTVIDAASITISTAQTNRLVNTMLSQMMKRYN